MARVPFVVVDSYRWREAASRRAGAANYLEVDFLAGACFGTFAIHTFASTQAAIVLWLCSGPKSLSGQLVPPGRE